MKQNYSILSLFFILLMGIMSQSILSAQNSQVDLSQLYRSSDASNLLAFNYPADWVITEETNFVSVADPDGKMTISFYTEALTASIMSLSANPQEGIRTFFQVLGTTYTGETTVSLQGQTVVGGFNLADGNAEYALLGIGRGLAPPGWIYVHVKGNAVDILGGSDTFMAIINTSGTLQIADTRAASTLPPNTGQQAPAAVTGVPVTVVPCFIQTTRTNSAQIRVGPGTNRGVLRFLDANRDFTVVGTATADDGSTWWRIDKNEAAPGQAANETWVANSQVTTSGGCDSVGTVAAPPIIRARPTAAPTTIPDNNSGQPTPVPGSNQLFVDFFATPGRILEGDCTMLEWDVRNAREVRLDGSSVSFQGSQLVCPIGVAPFSVEYELRVTPDSGPDVTETVFVQIDGNFVLCGIDYLPFSENSFVAAGSENYHYINLDPCESSRRIFIEMYANGNDGLDPYLDVFIDDVYYDSDDDSGGSLNAYIEVTIPAGAEYISLIAKGYNFATGGSYEIYAERLP